MLSRFKKMPSPALAVAFVALLAALTGTAVALPGSNTVTSGDIKTGAVTSSDIKNSTVRGKDVRNNTLTGSDVNESSLGNVPSASTASIAGAASVAGTANRLGPLQGRSFHFAVNGPAAGTTTTTVLSLPNVTLTATCTSGGTLDLTATAPAGTTHGLAQTATTDVASTGTDNENQDDDWNTGNTLDLLPLDPEDQIGHAEFSNGGSSSTTVNFETDNDTTNTFDCVAHGTALQG